MKKIENVTFSHAHIRVRRDLQHVHAAERETDLD